MTVEFRLEEDLSRIAGGNDRSEVYYNLLKWAVAQGRLVELLLAAREEVPGNPKLEAFYTEIIAPRLQAVEDSTAPADPWSVAVRDHGLWSTEALKGSPLVEALKPQVVRLVSACYREWQKAGEALPEDPWRDAGLPERALNCLEGLVEVSDQHPAFTAPETALLLLTPFLREAVVAGAVTDTAASQPLSLVTPEAPSVLRGRIDQAQQAAPQLTKKLRRLDEQGMERERDAIGAWLMYRAFFRAPELWMPDRFSRLCPDLIATLSAPDLCPGACAGLFEADWLLHLARCTYGDVDRMTLVSWAPRPVRIFVGRTARQKGQEVRMRMLAYLLCLSGQMAIDPRMLPDVIVDHIGLRTSLDPKEVLGTVDSAGWVFEGSSANLTITCRHPAIDLALQEQVERAGHVLRTIDQEIRTSADIKPLEGLPKRLDGTGIEIADEAGKPLYSRPHVQFHLSQDDVRELLMGENLYSDPSLAIRELYQNALDACRYREMRLRYLEKAGRKPEREWVGKIRFTQGQENGRDYIECYDNGIGMGMRELTECFARAGRRFRDTSEFIDEQAEWLRLDPALRLYPNSQFGVGVFSYFMLADELEVTTCRLDRNGIPGKRLKVHVSGSGSLFRIQEAGHGDEAGTTVRLYLSSTNYKPAQDQEERPISCLATLRDLLWVAEFGTRVEGPDGERTWEPGKLTHPTIAEEQICCTEAPDFWWVYEGGALLADGIRTNEERSVLVANLRGAGRPKLNVSRERLLEWSENWVRETARSQWQTAVEWSALTMDWLWRLEALDISSAAAVSNCLIGRRTMVPVGLGRYASVPIHYVGCWEPDKIYVLTPFRDYEAFPQFMRTLRKSLWSRFKIPGAETLFLDCEDQFGLLALVAPTAGDAKIFESHQPGQVFSDNINGPYGIISASSRVKESPLEIRNRIRKYEIIGMKNAEHRVDKMFDCPITYEPPTDMIALLDAMASASSPLANALLMLDHSVRLGEALEDLLIAARRHMGKLGFQFYLVDDVKLHELRSSARDRKLLSRRWNERGPYVRGRISPRHVVETALQLNEPPSVVLSRMSRYADFLQLELPELELSNLDKFNPCGKTLLALSSKLNGLPPIITGRVSPNHLWAVARRLDESVDSVCNRLAPYQSLFTFELPRNPKQIETWLHSLKRADQVTLSSQLTDDTSYWISGVVDPGHFAAAAMRTGEPVGAVVRRLQRHAPYVGLGLPRVRAADWDGVLPDRSDVCSLSIGLNQQAPWIRGSVSPFHVLVAALSIGETPRETLARLRKYAPLGLILPEGEPEDWTEETVWKYWEAKRAEEPARDADKEDDW